MCTMKIQTFWLRQRTTNKETGLFMQDEHTYMYAIFQLYLLDVKMNKTRRTGTVYSMLY